MTMPEHAFVYRARLDRVIDGDTIVAVIDCGFGLHLHHGNEGAHLRLLGVDTPERNEPGWDAARRFTRDWLLTTAGDLWPLTIQTTKADSFGRYLATVWRQFDARCLNDDLAAWLSEQDEA
jgi:micrococcal nuclease